MAFSLNKVSIEHFLFHIGKKHIFVLITMAGTDIQIHPQRKSISTEITNDWKKLRKTLENDFVNTFENPNIMQYEL